MCIKLYYITHYNMDKSFTENTGKIWSDEEDQKLIEFIQQGKHLDEISIKHGRTTGAIRARLIYMSKNLYHDGKSIDEIKQTIKLLTTREIQTAIGANVDEKKTQNIIPQIDKQYEILNRLDKLEEILSKLVKISSSQKEDDDVPIQVERVWTEQLLQRIEKHKDRKSKLKEIRKEHNIPVDEFYAKVKIFRDT
jgi:hypothetical protein